MRAVKKQSVETQVESEQGALPGMTFPWMEGIVYGHPGDLDAILNYIELAERGDMAPVGNQALVLILREVSFYAN